MINLVGWKAATSALLVHIFILTFAWVGFSVPLPRTNLGFYYAGSAIPADEVRVTARVDEVINKAAADPYSAAFFGAWVRLRNVDKPR